MHRPPSRQAARHIRTASLLLTGWHLLAAGATVLIAWTFITGDNSVGTVGLLTLAAAALLAFLQWFAAQYATCPLCKITMLGNHVCSRLRNARRLFGSQRLFVATSVLLTNRFRCPYCGEPSVLTPHQHGRR
jgi:hypothetical protein